MIFHFKTQFNDNGNDVIKYLILNQFQSFETYCNKIIQAAYNLTESIIFVA